MYIRRKCYSSLYDDLYNDYLYDKYFSDIDDYDYYDQREFAMNPTELAKLLYREQRGVLGKKGAYEDKLAQKQLAKLENMAWSLELDSEALSEEAKSKIAFDRSSYNNNRSSRWLRKEQERSLRNKNNFIRRNSYNYMN